MTVENETILSTPGAYYARFRFPGSSCEYEGFVSAAGHSALCCRFLYPEN